MNKKEYKIAYEKIVRFNSERYYILSDMGVLEKDQLEVNELVLKIKENHGCQLIINGVLPTLKYYLRLISNPKRCQEQLKECQCEVSPKVRVDSDDFAWCEKCEESIAVASKKRVIKNRNDPRFWGLDVKEKVLCGNCLKKLVEEMPKRKKYLFWEYRNRRYWEK